MALINLPEHEAQVTDFCIEMLGAFSQENPGITVSSVVLYAFPVYGTLHFCLDTSDNPAHDTEQDTRPGSPGFFVECPSFTYFEWRELYIAEWNEAYQGSSEDDEDDDEEYSEDDRERLEIRTISGETIVIGEDDGDEAVNKPVFDLLVQAMHRMTDHPVTKALNQEQTLHLGVEIATSQYSDYWSVSRAA